MQNFSEGWLGSKSILEEDESIKIQDNDDNEQKKQKQRKMSHLLVDHYIASQDIKIKSKREQIKK